ncbi:MAG: hypothetical protein ABIH36_03190 [bacterium]
MDKHHALILQHLVREYINTGQPVGSRLLSGTIRISASPATIRSRLRSLEQDGYLEQPHTSAGRLPTDQGYRYFVDQQLHSFRPSARKLSELARRLHIIRTDHPHLERAATHLLASLCQAIAVTGWLPSHQVQEAGLADLCTSEDSVDHNTLRELSFLLKHVDVHLPELAALSQNHTHVFIGRENPIGNARYTSFMTRAANLPNGQQAVFMLIGPKRMPYQRNADILDNLAQLFEYNRL